MTNNKIIRISVIGSNGGIGAAIVDELLSQGYENIYGVTISGKEKWGRNIQVIQANALNLQQLLTATKESEIIFGAFNASEYTDKSWGIEFPVFMENFIECGRINKTKLIFLDNVYSYADQKGKNHYTEDTLILPTNKKGSIREEISKKFIYEIKKHSLQGNIIKSSDLYGPYSLNSMIGDRYFEGVFKKNTAEIIPLGNNPHSFSYTRDVAKIAVITAFSNNQPIIIHTPNATAVGYQDMVRMTYKYLGTSPKESVAPLWLFYVLGLFVPPVKSMLGMLYQWDNRFIVSSKYNSNFSPTSLENGIKETVKWFKKNKNIIY